MSDTTPKLSQTTVTLSGLDDAVYVPHEQSGYSIDGIPGLVACRAWSFMTYEPLDHWLLVHAASGLSLDPKFSTRRDAVTVASRLADIDWTLDSGVLQADDRAPSAVRNAVREMPR